jgi:2-dehydro-3-deoxygluconokinase
VRDAPQDRPTSVQYYRRHSAASGLAVGDVPDQLVREATLLHVTGITAMLSESSDAALTRAVAVAREAGTVVTFDPNVRRKLGSPEAWRDVITTIAASADVVLTGVDDARAVTDGDPAAWFLDRGASTVVVKDGANGAWETDGDTTVRQPAFAVTAVDPVGAGDAFAAGWIHGRLCGLGRAERLRTAAAVAALCVGVRGDVPGLPDRETLQRVLALNDSPDVDR